MDWNNPNEYDDEQYVEGALKLDSALYTLFEAGASLDDTVDLIKNAIDNVADGFKADVTVTLEEAG